MIFNLPSPLHTASRTSDILPMAHPFLLLGNILFLTAKDTGYRVFCLILSMESSTYFLLASRSDTLRRTTQASLKTLGTSKEKLYQSTSVNPKKTMHFD